MKIRGKLFVSVLMVVNAITTINAGTPNCSNIGFQLGDFSNWTGTSWVETVYPDLYQNTQPVTGTNTGRHKIMSDTTLYDKNTNYELRTIPRGYKYSARLGNDATGCHLQTLAYTMNVDAKNALLIWRFAIVMQNPIQQHTEATKPFFKISITNQKNENVSACTDYTVVASPTLPGFHTYYPPGYDPNNTNTNDAVSAILWRDWTAVGIDLSPYAGNDINIMFTSADCKQGGHYCYAYIVAECMPLNLRTDYCNNDSVAVLSAPEGFLTYKWITPQNDTIKGRNISLDKPVEGAEYTCILTSEMGCSVTLKTRTYHFNPIADFDVTKGVCNGYIAFTNKSHMNNGELTNFFWNFGDGTTSDERNPEHTFSSNGMHKVALTAGNDATTCTNTLTKEIETFDPLKVFVTGDTIFCPGKSTTLTANGGAHYLWNTGDTTQTLVVTTPGIYSVKGFSSDRTCFSGYISKNVVIEPAWKVTFSGDTRYCLNDSTLITASGGLRYVWNTGATTPSIYAKKGNEYTVTAYNERDCEVTASIKTTEMSYPDPTFTMTPKTINLRNHTVTLQAMPQDSVQYVWNFGDGSDVASGNTVKHEYRISGDVPYYVPSLTLANSIGCSSSASDTIFVTPFVPNVFTPNGDGFNEKFMPNYDLTIYDRNGIELYKGIEGWDGKRNGKAVGCDTYFYLVKYQDARKMTRTLKGSVTIIK